ncbi:MAG: hypothetical protein R3F49_23960 [Planctomycetota bacterium]
MIIATLLIAGTLPQDVPSTLTPTQIAATLDRLFVDEPGDGRVWARGTTYKAAFGPDGFTYVPAFGSDVPSCVFDVDLERASIGGTALELDQAPRPKVMQRDASSASVALARGALREVYHLGRESVEQTFEFDALPGRGELRLTLDVTSELLARVQGSGFAFSGPHGEVRWSAAFAYDAAGRSLPLVQRWTGESIEIVVPEDFVRDAKLPLVVDPILSTFTLNTIPDPLIDVDSAYDAANDVFNVVVSVRRSLNDHDVFSMYHTALIAVTGLPDPVDITTENWNAPRTANSHFAERFLCVANVGNSPGSRRIRGRVREAASGVGGAAFDITSGASDHVDVGGFGNDTATSADFMVVYQAHDLATGDIDIRARTVSQTGATGPAITIAGGATDQDLRPSISRSSGRPELNTSEHDYMIVWQREVSPTNRDIWAHVVSYDGSLSGHSAFRAYRFSDAVNPDVSMQNRRTNLVGGAPYWAIAFERLVGSDYDIFVVFATDGNADNARNVSDMQDVDVQLDQRAPVSRGAGSGYMLTYLSENPSSGFDAYATTLGVVLQDGELRAALGDRRDALPAAAGATTAHSIATTWEGSVSTSGISFAPPLATWLTSPSTSAPNPIQGATLGFSGGIPIGSQYCSANANSSGRSAWIRAAETLVNPPSPSSNIWLECADLPPHAFGYFLASLQEGIGTTPANSVGNLCLAGSIGRFAGNVLNSGPGGSVLMFMSFQDVPQPLGSVAAMSGEWWHFQYWTRDSAGGAATSNFSNALRIWMN